MAYTTANDYEGGAVNADNTSGGQEGGMKGGDGLIWFVWCKTQPIDITSKFRVKLEILL